MASLADGSKNAWNYVSQPLPWMDGSEQGSLGKSVSKSHYHVLVGLLSFRNVRQEVCLCQDWLQCLFIHVCVSDGDSLSTCRITTTSLVGRTNVPCTCRMREAAVETTTASSLRSKCFHAGPSSTTSLSPLPPGREKEISATSETEGGVWS